MKKDSNDYVSSGFENSFSNNPAHFAAKYSKYKHCTKNLTRNAKSHKIKIGTDFNDANS